MSVIVWDNCWSLLV